MFISVVLCVICRVVMKVYSVEQDLLTLLENLRSAPVFDVVRVVALSVMYKVYF